MSELGYGDFRFEKISNNLEAKAPFLRGKVPAVGEKLLKNLGPLGFNALPNIVCYAKKIKKGLDYRAQIRRILEKSLVGRETKMLDVWMEEVEGKV